MKLMVLSATHRVDGDRGNIYRFFLARMRHIREKYGVELLVVGNEGVISRTPTVESGAYYVEHPNNPVSMKWNAGMKALQSHNPDYVMILGSDDLVSDGLIEKYLEILPSGDYNVMGITDSYYCSYNVVRAHFGQCLYWHGYRKSPIIGYAKALGADLLDAVDWQPWPDGRNAGLDFSMNRKLKETRHPQRTYKFSIKEEDVFHIDVKTHGNISSIAPLVRRSTELDLNIYDLLYKYLPEEEAKNILTYMESVKKEGEIARVHAERL